VKPIVLKLTVTDRLVTVCVTRETQIHYLWYSDQLLYQLRYLIIAQQSNEASHYKTLVQRTRSTAVVKNTTASCLTSSFGSDIPNFKVMGLSLTSDTALIKKPGKWPSSKPELKVE